MNTASQICPGATVACLLFHSWVVVSRPGVLDGVLSWASGFEPASGQPEPSMTKQYHTWQCILVDAAWSDSIMWELQESSRKRSASSYHLSVTRSCRCLAVGWSQNFFEINLICNTNGLVIQNPQLHTCGWETCVSVVWVLLFFLTFSVLSWCFQEKSWRDILWSHYECKFRIIWRQSCAGFLPTFLLSELNFRRSSQEGKSQQIFFLPSDAAWGGEV